MPFPSSASHWHVTGLCRCSSSFLFLIAQSFHHPGRLCGSSLNSLQSLWWRGAQKQMSHSRWFHLRAETERLLLYLTVMWCDYLAFNGADLSWLFSVCVLGLDCGHRLWLLKEPLEQPPGLFHWSEFIHFPFTLLQPLCSLFFLKCRCHRTQYNPLMVPVFRILQLTVQLHLCLEAILWAEILRLLVPMCSKYWHSPLAN